MLTLGSNNISPESLRIDDKVGRIVTIIGIPSAFLLHGYVGFIFGSIKANPWWSTPMMPIVFLFSAIVSGIAMVMLLYIVLSWWRRAAIDMLCVDTIATYLFYAFLVDFALEMLDLIHRIYEADESFRALDFMVHTKLFVSQIVLQIIVGTLVPIALLGRDAAGAAGAARRGSGSTLTAGVLTLDRHLRDALERRHRRPAVLEELPRLHDLQAGVRDARGAAAGDPPDAAAVRHPRGAAADPAAVGAPRLGGMTAGRNVS